MGAGQSTTVQPQLYATKSDILSELRSYPTTANLNSTRDEILRQIQNLDSLYVKNTQLASYISKDDLKKELENKIKEIDNKIDKEYVKNTQLEKTLTDISKEYTKNTQLDTTLKDYTKNTELSPFSKTDDIKDNYVNKKDKAVYSEATVLDNTNYVTPFYWTQRYNANKSTEKESDNNDNKFITPKFLNDKKLAWSVTPINDDKYENVLNDKFVTPGWVSGKITSELSNYTINSRSSSDIVSDNKFTTPGWTNKKLNDERIKWTVNSRVSVNNTDDNKFATPGWITSKLGAEKNNWTVSASNDTELINNDDDKFTTAGWTNAKLNAEKNNWTVSSSNNSSLNNTADDKFTTPGWVTAKINSFKPTLADADKESDNKFATTKYLADRTATNETHLGSNFRFVTPDFLENKWFPTKLAISTTDSASIDKFVTPLYVDARIEDKLTTINLDLSQNEKDVVISNLSKNDTFVESISDRLKDEDTIHVGVAKVLTSPTHGNFLLESAQYLSNSISDNILNNPLDSRILANRVADSLITNYKQALIQDIGTQITNFNIQGNLRMGDRNSSFETANQTVIQDGKFANTDAQINFINSVPLNSALDMAKNSYLQINGAARGYQISNVNVRRKRRVKIFDDLLVDNKVAIGPGVDTMTNIPANPEDNYFLKVGGDTKINGKLDIDNGLILYKGTDGNLWVSSGTKTFKLSNFS